MITGDYAQLVQIKEGLEVIQSYVTDASMVIRQYIIHIPEVVVGDISGPDMALLTTLGWKEHAVEGGLFFSLVETP